jgi:hypothetical protein
MDLADIWYVSALIAACREGNIEIVKLLLNDNRVDPAVMDSEALYRASVRGHLDIVQLLLEDGRVDPAAMDSEALMGASRMGHLEIVLCLLNNGRVNPAANNNQAIKRAYLYNHAEVFKILLKIPSVKRTFLTEMGCVEGGGLDDLLFAPFCQEGYISTERLNMITCCLGEIWRDSEFNDWRTRTIRKTFIRKEYFTIFWEYIIEKGVVIISGKGSTRIHDLPWPTPQQKRWIGEIETTKRKIIMAVRKKTDQYGLPIGPLVDILEFSGGVGTQIDMLGPL